MSFLVPATGARPQGHLIPTKPRKAFSVSTLGTGGVEVGRSHFQRTGHCDHVVVTGVTSQGALLL